MTTGTFFLPASLSSEAALLRQAEDSLSAKEEAPRGFWKRVFG